MKEFKVPYSLETEKSVLALLLSGMYHHLEIPEPEIFFNDANQEIASAIKKLTAEGSEVGITSVWAKLQDSKKGTACTHGYLGSLSYAMIDAGSYHATLGLLKEAKQKRDIVALCEKLSYEAPTANIADTVQFAMTEFARIDRGKNRSDMILPLFETALDLSRVNLQAPDFVVHGLLRKGQRMMVQTASKAGKSWLSIYRSVCISSGQPYLGHEVTQGPVVFVNFELPRWHVDFRIRKICEALKIEIPPALITWNLRGKKFTDITLLADLERQIRTLPEKPIHIEIDPIYKLYQGREENKTEQMAQVLSLIEDISEGHDCSIAYNHHHSKGDKSKQEMLDRSSGAGVFARDADVIFDLIKHAENNCFAVSSVTRTEAQPDNFVIEWSFPLFIKRPDLDPQKLKRRASSGKAETSPNIIIDLLSETWTESTKIMEKAKREYGVGRSTYYELRKKAIASGLVDVDTQNGFLRRFPSPSSPNQPELIQNDQSMSVHP
jgi:hypothetical protein